MVCLKDKLLSIGLVVIVLIGQLGCSTTQHRPWNFSQDIHAKLGTIGVVAARFDPEPDFEMPATNWLSGMARGAGGGPKKGLQTLGKGADALGRIKFVPEPPPWVAVPVVGALTVMFATVGGVLGMFHGIADTEPAQTVEEAEAALRQGLAAMRIQEAMRDQFITAAHSKGNYSFVILEEEGPTTPEENIRYSSRHENIDVDSILEISVLSLGLDGDTDANPPLALFMHVRLRLIRTADSVVLYDYPFTYRTTKRLYSEWAANEAELFRDAINQGYEHIAREMVDEILVRYFFRMKHGETRVVGLLPVDPEHQEQRFEIVFTEVHALQPTIRWEALPIANATDVSYDLRIWTSVMGWPGNLIYAREALPKPSHTLEEPLKPSTEYLWTVRARFALDNFPRISTWAMSDTVMWWLKRYDALHAPHEKNPYYYRFKTTAH